MNGKGITTMTHLLLMFRDEEDGLVGKNWSRFCEGELEKIELESEEKGLHFFSLAYKWNDAISKWLTLLFNRVWFILVNTPEP